MYIQVRQPLGALFTVNGVTYKIPCIVKIKATERQKFESELKKIKADYVIPVNRIVVKPKVQEIPKKVSKKSEETVNASDKTKKSDRKNS